MINLRRVYDPEAPGEGYKVLVDRLWPRGLSKEETRWNEWMKDIAPSNELRLWFRHDLSRWPEFKERYTKELSHKTSDLSRLRQLESAHGTLTLLFAAKDAKHNNATVLREYMESGNTG